MASDRRVTFLINARIKGFTKGLTKAQKKFRKFGKDMKRTGRSLTQNVTAPLGILGGIAIKTAADFESLRQSMDILNGSAEEGARNFERLKRFSAETPFQLQDLASAQNMLQGFSLSADEAFESMSMIGDIAAVTGGDIKGIGIAFGQAAAEGRLMTRDIRQLINQGVPAIQLLADTMDVATSEVLDLASEGKITFDILVQAFKDATSEGGMFANGMEKQAQTLAGLWSTLRDNVSIALGELGTTIVETFDLKQVAKDLIGNIKLIVQRFQEMSKESKKQILQVAGLFMAGGPLLMALGQAAIAISAFVKFVRTRFFLITAAVAGTIGVIKQWRQVWNNVFGDGSQDIDNIFTATKKGMSEVMGVVMDFTEEALGMNGALGSFRDLLSGLDKDNPDAALDNIVSSTKDATSAFQDLNTLLGQGTGGGDSGGGQSFGTSVGGSNIGIGKMASQGIKDIANMKAAVSQYQTVTEAAGITTLTFMERFRQGFARAGEQATLMSDAVTMAFQSMADVGISSLNDLLAVTINTARKIISAELAKGIAAAVRGALTNVPFPFNIAAAAGAGAAAAGVFNAAVPKLATGGVIPDGFPNDTYPAMLSSGETVIPSPKPLPSMGGGVIHNNVYLDGKLVYENQKEVNRKINR